MTRTLVVWCPDWPLVAAGIPPDRPAAVFHANRVVACTAAARAEGVTRGLRRREAQGRCPELRVEAFDPARDTRAFEPVVAAVNAFSPRLEVTRPGACALPTRGPSRYFGGDESLALHITTSVDAVLDRLPSGGLPTQVGIAEGPFAASIAARRNLIIPAGETPTFLAPLPVSLLDEPELTGLLTRLGLRTLGAFAAVPPGDVIGRFGPIGVVAHRRAQGVDDRDLDCCEPPPDMSVEAILDPPADRVDTAAFAAKSITDRLCADLAERGLVCSCVRIEAETEHGEHLSRVWRHYRAFTPTTVSERVRWQLEGWLTADPDATTGGLTLVRIAPEEVQRGDGFQDGFWGGTSAADERAARGLARVQGLLGPDAVVTAVLGGGRGFADQVHLVPWGEPRPKMGDAEAWPGRIPSPAPALVWRRPAPAELVDASGEPVCVTSRSVATSIPSRMSIDGGPWEHVESWAGPWTVDERWWDADAHRRYARFQVVMRDGAAHLLILEGGRWWVEASYD